MAKRIKRSKPTLLTNLICYYLLLWLLGKTIQNVMDFPKNNERLINAETNNQQPTDIRMKAAFSIWTKRKNMLWKNRVLYDKTERHSSSIMIFTLLLSGDVETNPGPTNIRGKYMSYSEAVKIGFQKQNYGRQKTENCSCQTGSRLSHTWQCALQQFHDRISNNIKQNQDIINCRCQKGTRGLHDWKCAIKQFEHRMSKIQTKQNPEELKHSSMNSNSSDKNQNKKHKNDSWTKIKHKSLTKQILKSTPGPCFSYI